MPNAGITDYVRYIYNAKLPSRPRPKPSPKLPHRRRALLGKAGGDDLGHDYLLKGKAGAHAAQDGAVGLLDHRLEWRHRLHLLDQARACAVTPTRMLRPPLGAKSFEAAAHIIFQVQPLSPPSSSLSISPWADEANIRSADEGCDYSFTTNAAAPISGFSAFKLKLDMACGATNWAQNWRLHDLRHTARSLMSRAGVNPDIAERCLGHVIGGVRGVYDRQP